jgi:hypothetical protein
VVDLMSGHGSARPEDRANHPGRQVSRPVSDYLAQGPHPTSAPNVSSWGGTSGFGGVDPGYEAEHDYSDEMRTRSRLEDEYGGGAGDWDH